MGGAGGGGAAAAAGGGGQGQGAAPVVDLRVLFKCLTCDMKESRQTEQWIRGHKIVCRRLQQQRQADQHKKKTGKKPAPAQPKPKKGSAPAQPKPKKGSAPAQAKAKKGSGKASGQPKAKKR